MTTILAFLLYSLVLLLSKLTQESIELSQRVCEEPSERVCPTCGSEHLIKNGSAHNGKSKYSGFQLDEVQWATCKLWGSGTIGVLRLLENLLYQCKSCGHKFVVNPTKTTVSKEIKQLIERLLLERIQRISA